MTKTTMPRMTHSDRARQLPTTRQRRKHLATIDTCLQALAAQSVRDVDEDVASEAKGFFNRIVLNDKDWQMFFELLGKPDRDRSRTAAAWLLDFRDGIRSGVFEVSRFAEPVVGAIQADLSHAQNILRALEREGQNKKYLKPMKVEE